MSPARVLVVEDEAVVAMALESSLQRMGYEVVATTPTGEEAVELAATRHIDIILMDIQLAGPMTGIEAAERITADQAVPIIYLTAFSDDATLRRAKGAEPSGYLVKPYDDKELRAALEIGLHNARVSEDRRASTRALRERERVFQQALDESGSLVYMKDARGRFTLMNRAFEEVFGVDRTRARGLEDADVLPRGVREALGEADEEVLRSNQDHRSRQAIPLRDGTHTFLANRFPIRDETGTVVGTCTVLTDAAEHGEAAADGPDATTLEATLRKSLSKTRTEP